MQKLETSLVFQASMIIQPLKFPEILICCRYWMLEIVKGAKEFNIPTIRANRKLVGYVNGGLQDPSALIFVPDWGNEKSQPLSTKFNYPSLSGIYRTKNDDDISKQITSVELTRIFMQRLKKYNPVLEAAVTYTEESANQQAKDADKLLAREVYLGPLHGIHYGLKDIISVPHYKTTWGSTTFKDQVLDTKAWVYKRLKSAVAVLVTKLVTGLLAYDDIWFGGRTRNPWNIEEFTTSSSSGPAACTPAGMVLFAIGSETVGSMTLPTAHCGVVGLRPTFGSVGRTGDKLGPVCRSAVVLDAIRGNDSNYLSSRDILLEDHFLVDITKLTVGYVDDAEMEVFVHVLESKGVSMVPFKLNYTVDFVQGILDMLAHFDEWQRSRKDDDYKSQSQWPPELHRARIFPAVDYIQRARGRLIREVRDSFSVDAFIGNAADWERVCMGNLVGMPVIVVPTGFTNISDPPCSNCLRKIAMTTGIYLPLIRITSCALALAMAYQSVTDHHKK
ncbi:glutamyl-tRNA(Gln) amidotransferase subunit A [Pyrus ussuriensis x Pyrus communis]|uniref:Glutamyl-tRNA(Gln) amidotransferase subunit A n=1 Tax=Pyrus ussuriensis x Pyrus communis TaxID=2448454 RepID=A0A5N5G113_9ROSA|nr:glutamyl-tRNA(Gln) amidotransferase subunit A [Pyrus ussuriensis x Pyrus communis]